MAPFENPRLDPATVRKFIEAKIRHQVMNDFAAPVRGHDILSAQMLGTQQGYQARPCTKLQDVPVLNPWPAS